jgi:hypothetical protein
LNRLMKRGAIELVEQSGKKKYYQATERLFNIYYLMRKRGVGDDRVKATIDFMAIFYPNLMGTALKIVNEIETLPFNAIEDHDQTIRYIEEVINKHSKENEYDAKLFDVIKKRKELLIENKKLLIKLKDMRGKTIKILMKYPTILTEEIIKLSLDEYAYLNLEILVEEHQKPELEPLIVGLKIYLGEERPLVAQEVFEIGKDIADRIRTKQAELANSQATE